MHLKSWSPYTGLQLFEIIQCCTESGKNKFCFRSGSNDVKPASSFMRTRLLTFPNISVPSQYAFCVTVKLVKILLFRRVIFTILIILRAVNVRYYDKDAINKIFPFFSNQRSFKFNLSSQRYIGRSRIVQKCNLSMYIKFQKFQGLQVSFQQNHTLLLLII